MREVTHDVGFGNRKEVMVMGVLKRIGILAAVLAVGILGLAACPPGSINLANEFAAPTGANALVDTDAVAGTDALQINTPGTYCVPATNVNLGVDNDGDGDNEDTIIIATNDVVIVGETPSAAITFAAAAVPNNGLPMIQIGAGLLNVVLRSFTLAVNIDPAATAVIQDQGAHQLLIDGVIINDTGNAGGIAVPVIILNGYQPEVRDCTFRLPNTAQPVIQLAGGMNATIHDNQVIGAGANPTFFVQLSLGGTYSGLEIYNNTVNFAGAFFGIAAAADSLVDSVIRDNQCGILSPTGVMNDAGIDLGASTNTQVLGNTMALNATTYGIFAGAGSSNVEIRGNDLTVGTANVVMALIHVAGTNTTVAGNTLDASLGLVRATAANDSEGAIYANGVNTTISDNTIVGIANAPAIYVDGGATNAILEGNVINNVDSPLIDTNVTDGALTALDPDGDGNNDGAAIYVQAINAQLEGNRVEGVQGGTDNHALLLNANNATVTDNTFTQVDDGVGIFVNGTINNEIQGNTLEDVGQDGILLFSAGADNNEVNGNTLRRVAKRAVVNTAAAPPAVGNFAGIRIQGDNNSIGNNVIEDVGGTVWPAWICGIDVQRVGSVNNEILNNTIRQMTQAGNIVSAAIGILVRAGQNHLVQGNTIQNTGNMQIGIDIRTTNRMEINENEIEGMVYAGLYLRGGTVTNVLTVKGNKFTDDYIGMVLSAGAADITDSVVQGGHIALYVDRFGVAGQYTVENNCFMDADILAQNDGTGTLVAQKNYWHPAPVAGTNIIGAVDFSNALSSCPFAPAPGLSHTYGAVAGWYMVSVPTAGDTASIFGVTLYHWNGTNYDTLSGSDALEPGKGYWAYLPANASVTASGTVPTTDVTVALGAAGWHMISAPWSYSKSDILVIKGAETKTWADAVAAGWVLDTIYTYDPVAGNYTTPSTLDPWYGYWVRTYEDGISLKFEVAKKLTTSCACALLAPKALETESLPPGPPSMKALANELDVANFPNPITDVHTTTFKVLGPMASQVEEMRVRIFDLAGRLVWEGEAYGPELVWHTDNLAGQYLANGVYLYQVQVKVGGTWITTSLKKLAIYR